MGTPTEQNEQAQRDQEEAQFSHEAEALYALTKHALGDNSQDWLVNAKAQINAIAPDHFTF